MIKQKLSVDKQKPTGNHKNLSIVSDELLKKNILQTDSIQRQFGADGQPLYRNTTQNAAAKVVDLQ